MTNPALDSRARFETWVMRNPRAGTHLDRSNNGTYKDNRVAAKWTAWQAAIASMAVIDPETGGMATWCRDMIEGMSVSVDVSTGDDDAGHRYFGTITEVMDDPYDKHHVTLLVQDAAPNFNTNPVLAALAAKETQ